MEKKPFKVKIKMDIEKIKQCAITEQERLAKELEEQADLAQRMFRGYLTYMGSTTTITTSNPTVVTVNGNPYSAYNVTMSSGSSTNYTLTQSDEA